MAEKYQNKYRIASARLQTWDYSWNAAYFVTICTQNKECFFGNIVDGNMHLSETGKIAHKFWMEIPNHFPFVKLGEFIVMPNHMHGIIIIDKLVDGRHVNGTPNLGVPTAPTPNLGVSTMPGIPKLGGAAENIQYFGNPKPPISKSGGKNEQWKPGTLGVIINQYKRICTINARKIHSEFGWQPRFYDIIIRDDRAFHAISNYIINNPEKW
ncbi:MAG TPA: hypothetical protein VFD29_05235 [Gillisia sp.]|nr:hypothetical protein [Gillisia sp.]